MYTETRSGETVVDIYLFLVFMKEKKPGPVEF